MDRTASLNKIAEITVFFWVAKVIATTLGETGGDFIAQTLDFGYVIGFLITVVLLAAVLFAQVRSDTYRPPCSGPPSPPRPPPAPKYRT